MNLIPLNKKMKKTLPLIATIADINEDNLPKKNQIFFKEFKYLETKAV